MDNQINSIRDNEFQDGQTSFYANTQSIKIGSDFDANKPTDCDKCSFHEAEHSDINFGNLCSKCYEWLCS